MVAKAATRMELQKRKNCVAAPGLCLIIVAILYVFLLRKCGRLTSKALGRSERALSTLSSPFRLRRSFGARRGPSLLRGGGPSSARDKLGGGAFPAKSALVCMSGNPRTLAFPHIYESLKSNVLDAFRGEGENRTEIHLALMLAYFGDENSKYLRHVGEPRIPQRVCGGAGPLEKAIRHLRPRQLLLLEQNDCTTYRFWREATAYRTEGTEGRRRPLRSVSLPANASRTRRRRGSRGLPEGLPLITGAALSVRPPGGGGSRRTLLSFFAWKDSDNDFSYQRELQSTYFDSDQNSPHSHAAKCDDSRSGPWLMAKWVDECFTQERMPFLSDQGKKVLGNDSPSTTASYLAFDYYLRARPDLFFWRPIPSAVSGLYDHSDNLVAAMDKHDAVAHDAFWIVNRRALAKWWLDRGPLLVNSSSPQISSAFSALSSRFFAQNPPDPRRMCLNCHPPRPYTSVHDDLESGLGFGCCPELNELFLPRWQVRYEKFPRSFSGCIARDAVHIDCHRIPKKTVHEDVEAIMQRLWDGAVIANSRIPTSGGNASAAASAFFRKICQKPNRPSFRELLGRFIPSSIVFAASAI
ncbi:unnamed protein product [Amoebophrya sp. A25]|nr:unnamed protein product [Amoebophrya sp. A25]|eukprot:GSA25T00023373001.1